MNVGNNMQTQATMHGHRQQHVDTGNNAHTQETMCGHKQQCADMGNIEQTWQTMSGHGRQQADTGNNEPRWASPLNYSTPLPPPSIAPHHCLPPYSPSLPPPSITPCPSITIYHTVVWWHHVVACVRPPTQHSLTMHDRYERTMDTTAQCTVMNNVNGERKRMTRRRRCQWPPPRTAMMRRSQCPPSRMTMRALLSQSHCPPVHSPSLTALLSLSPLLFLTIPSPFLTSHRRTHATNMMPPYHSMVYDMIWMVWYMEWYIWYGINGVVW